MEGKDGRGRGRDRGKGRPGGAGRFVQRTRMKGAWKGEEVRNDSWRKMKSKNNGRRE